MSQEFNELEKTFGLYSDEMLSELFYDGDQYVFEIIYDRWKDKIYSFIWNFLNYNDEDALNVSADLFIKLFKYMKVNKIEKFKAFIYRMARNESINYLSSKKSENIFDYQEDKLLKVVDSFNGIDKTSLNNDFKIQLLKNLLEGIEQKFREVIYLYYFEQKNYDEISLILDTNKNTVGTLLARGKKKIKDLIKQAGYQEIFID